MDVGGHTVDYANILRLTETKAITFHYIIIVTMRPAVLLFVGIHLYYVLLRFVRSREFSISLCEISCTIIIIIRIIYFISFARCIIIIIIAAASRDKFIHDRERRNKACVRGGGKVNNPIWFKSTVSVHYTYTLLCIDVLLYGGSSGSVYDTIIW